MNKELTIDNIIELLSIDGIGSKQIVLDKLKNANYRDLCWLRRSVNEKIVEISLKEDRKCKRNCI